MNSLEGRWAVRPQAPQCSDPFADDDNCSLSSVSTASEGSYQAQAHGGGGKQVPEGEGDIPKVRLLRLDEVSFERSNRGNVNSGEKQLFEASITSYVPPKEREKDREKEKGFRERRKQNSRGDRDRDHDHDRDNSRRRRDFIEAEDVHNGRGREQRERNRWDDRDRSRSNKNDSSNRDHRKESKLIVDKKPTVVPAKGFQLLTRPNTFDVDKNHRTTSPPPPHSSTIPLTKMLSRDDMTVHTTSTDSNAAIISENSPPQQHHYPANITAATGATNVNANSIYVGNLSPETTKSQIFKTFADFGRVGKIDLNTRGFGFVEFESNSVVNEVMNAYEFDKSRFMIHGRVVDVHEKLSTFVRDTFRSNCSNTNNYDTLWSAPAPALAPVAVRASSRHKSKKEMKEKASSNVFESSTHSDNGLRSSAPEFVPGGLK